MNLVNEGVLPPGEMDDRDERREEQERARSRKTVADIVADIRKCAQISTNSAERIKDAIPKELLKSQAEIYGVLADRLEAAWKRESDRLMREPRSWGTNSGNAAAMREALEAIRDLAYEVQDMNREGDVKTSMPTAWVIDIVSAALSAPPRQCDVGTAEEQDARFGEFCVTRRTGSCAGCPDPVGGFTVANGIRECALVWAQMPYEASETSRAHRAGEKTTNQTTKEADNE